MNKYQQKHKIVLTKKERKELAGMTRKGRYSVRVIKRVRILLKSADGWKDEDIAALVDVSVSTVERVRYRYEEGGVERALYDAPRSGQPRKLDEKAEAYLVALACSDPPEGRDHWTLELLQERMIADGKVKTISRFALWSRLRDRKVKPWLEKNVVHTESDRAVY